MVRDAEQMSAGDEPEFAAVAAVRDGPRPVGIAEGPDALPLEELCPALALVELVVEELACATGGGSARARARGAGGAGAP